MRRTHAARFPTKRRQLAFEPLEPRELLAADAGFDWWAAPDVPVDDWSWTFDDASSVDPGGDAWWDDTWWVGDVSWDAPAADGTAFDTVDLGGSDETGYDWFADVGGADAGGAGGVDPVVDVVIPPAPDLAGDAPDDSMTVVLPPPIVLGPGFTGEDRTVICILLPAAEETSTDVAPAADAPTDAAVTADATDDVTDVSWVFDTPLVDGVPSQPTDGIGIGDDPVVDVVADDPFVPPTIVVVTPVADPPSPTVAVSVDPVHATAMASAANRFAGWGQMFLQALGRPDGDIDGASVGGQAGGQPGSGRPRLRLPFRPLV